MNLYFKAKRFNRRFPECFSVFCGTTLLISATTGMPIYVCVCIGLVAAFIIRGAYKA